MVTEVYSESLKLATKRQKSHKLVLRFLCVFVAHLNGERGDSRAAPFDYQLSVLEVELHCKLNKPWFSGCGNATEVDTANASIRVTEVGVVEDIEEL